MGSLPFRCPLHRPATLKVSSDRPSTMTWTVPKASKRTTTHTRRQHEQRAHAQTADAAVAHRVQRQQQHALRDGSCPASTPMRRAARSLIAASANSQQHTRSGCCSLVTGVGAQQPTAARRCGSFRIAAVQLLSEAVDVERGRFSKIRARLSTRLLALSTTSVTQGHGSQRRGHEVSGQNPTFINRPPLRIPFLTGFGISYLEYR